MECNFNKKKILQILVYLIGVGLFVCLSYSTFETFSSFRTTVVSSKKSCNNFPPPTIVICQRSNDNRLQLNDKMNMSLYIYSDTSELHVIANVILNLTVGNNTYEEGIPPGNQTFVIVKEFNSPWLGLCYAVIIPESLPMNIASWGSIQIQLSQEIEDPKFDAYIMVSSDDWYGLLLIDFGGLKPLKIPSLELGSAIQIIMERRKYTEEIPWYLAKDKCTDYPPGKESYMGCLVKTQMICFEENASAVDSGCACIPNNDAYKSYFDIFPTSLEWDQCKSISEKEKCVQIMLECLPYKTRESIKPCMQESYVGQIINLNGASLLTILKYVNLPPPEANEIMFSFVYGTMDVQINTEQLQYSIGDFIGTVGGFYSLYVGFSVTGLIWQVINFFMKD